MAKEKRSFFERLTGTVSLEEEGEFQEEEGEGSHPHSHQQQTHKEAEHSEPDGEWAEEEQGEGQLTVDVYQTPETIVIKALVAGVTPDNLDVSITRDMVTIRGSRDEVEEITDDNYFYRELYWGSFSRTILLPQEIEVEEAAAAEKQGLLTITLPKIDKEKQTKLKVRVG